MSSANQEPSSVLAVRREQPVELVRSVDWQRLWLALQAKPWTVLAVIPASSGAPPQFAVKVAITLARTGMVHLNAPIHVADGTGVPLAEVMTFLADINRCRDAGDRILVALAPLAEDPTSETLARAADSALLCVLFEEMDASEAKRTVDKIGKDRFIGSSIFRSSQL
jgi:hypothetical protein